MCFFFFWVYLFIYFGVAILRLKEEAMQCMESVSADKKSWMNSVQLWSSNNKADTASEVKLVILKI